MFREIKLVIIINIIITPKFRAVLVGVNVNEPG